MLKSVLLHMTFSISKLEAKISMLRSVCITWKDWITRHNSISSTSALNPFLCKIWMKRWNCYFLFLYTRFFFGIFLFAQNFIPSLVVSNFTFRRRDSALKASFEDDCRSHFNVTLEENNNAQMTQGRPFSRKVMIAFPFF